MWSTGARKHIDYILVDSRLRTNTIDADACNNLDFGSDHRCIRIALSLQIRSVRKLRRCRTKRFQSSPELDDQEDPTTYHEALDRELIVAGPSSKLQLQRQRSALKGQ